MVELLLRSTGQSTIEHCCVCLCFFNMVLLKKCRFFIGDPHTLVHHLEFTHATSASYVDVH